MSERLYYRDAYQTKFEAKVAERFEHDGRFALTLDQTYFYPTAGGQPHDTGQINNVPVTDVTVRKADGAIIHWLVDEVTADEITGKINWPRRFDHMQQHTGQHILTQAFLQTAEAKTVSFHLSEASVTIDLHTAEITPAQIEEAEELANQIVWQNRTVAVHTVTSEQAKNLDVRKIPTYRTGQLRLIRLIDIEKFDLTACGGTHVARTGGVGLIKIVKLERRGEGLRVEFACGNRALHDYRLKNSIANHLTAVLTTGYAELLPSVNRLQDDLKQAQRLIKKQQSELMQYEAAQLLQSGKQRGPVTVITHVFNDRDANALRSLGNHLAKHDDVIALLGLAGDKSQLIFCRSANAPGQMNQLLKPALQMLGTTAGGGNESFAQGGGPAANEDQVLQALGRAERLLLGQIG
jgi:alanyl-tRNA synthetase